MTSPLDRDELIEILESLGGDQDEAVLAAARKLHERITAAGLTWDDVLELDDDDEDLDDDPDHDTAHEPDDDSEDGHAEDAAPDSPAERAERDAEALALIDKLMARPGISDDFRTELQDYKVDIAEAEFGAADLRYLQAVYKRLVKQR